MKLILLPRIKMIELRHPHLVHCRVPRLRAVEIEAVTLTRSRIPQVRITHCSVLDVAPDLRHRRVLRKVACEGCWVVMVRRTRQLLLIRRVLVGGRKTVSRMNLLLVMVVLPRSGKLLLLLLLPLPIRRYVHRLEGVILVDGPIQALQHKRVLRRSMTRELSLDDWRC